MKPAAQVETELSPAAGFLLVHRNLVLYVITLEHIM